MFDVHFPKRFPCPVILLSGLISAPFTPFKDDLTLALAKVGPYAEYLHRHGVRGAFVAGTTGEGASLTSQERRDLLECWQAEKPKGLQLIAHVGHQSLAESCALATHAQACGADAVGSLAPSFFKPGNLADLVACCAQIAAAAPALPFYYYHMPAMTGVNFAMVDFLPRAAEAIPNFAGIKFTHENLMDYGLTLAAAGPQRAILFGRDEILLCALALGAPGAVGSTYNYLAPLYTKLMAAFHAGRQAEAYQLQLKSQQIIAVMVKHGGLSAGKAIMGLIGLDCGPLRMPLPTLSPDQIAALRAELDAAGMFTQS